MLLAPFFHIGEKTKMYFLKDNSNMLSEKKFSKKSPSKIDISSVLEQIGLLSRGKVSICSQGEALGGIAERPLTGRDTYNIRRSRTSLMSGCCLQRRVVGVWGQSPRSTGAGTVFLLGVGKAHGFSGLPPALIKRKRHLQASLPLNPLYGNIAVKGRSAIPPKASPCEHMLTFPLDNIRLFSRSEG